MSERRAGPDGNGAPQSSADKSAEDGQHIAGGNTAQGRLGYPKYFPPHARPQFLNDDRRWFAEHPGERVRRRVVIPGEFTPHELGTPPAGFIFEVLVQVVAQFKGGDSLRQRNILLVPIESRLQ
jgi:hypothetical protein